MSRLILLIVLIGAIVAAITLVAGALRTARAPATVPAVGTRRSAIRMSAFVLLMAVMTGVGAGWLGAG